MAEFIVCGNKNNKLPDWKNWQCPLCEDDLLYDTVGCHNRKERQITTKHHASAPSPNPFIKYGWVPSSLVSEDIETKCLRIATELGIPEKHQDAAVQEGLFAYRENRELTEAIRYWAESEHII